MPLIVLINENVKLSGENNRQSYVVINAILWLLVYISKDDIKTQVAIQVAIMYCVLIWETMAVSKIRST